MGVHQFDKELRPDDEFIPGQIQLLVEGNQCRALDGRRTTGIIEQYFPDSAMFRWRITKYEDKGKYWDLPAERITHFQFERDAERLTLQSTRSIEEKIRMYQQPLLIRAERCDRLAAEKCIQETTTKTLIWLKEESLFLPSDKPFDFSSGQGSELLAADLRRYMETVDLARQEELTAETMVLNPNSGEWIKGMEITMAQLGLASYEGTVPRTGGIFVGPGSRDNRQKYIIHRLAFVRAMMAAMNITEVVLYRGMASESDWREVPRTLLPCTFSLKVAEAFCDFGRDSKHRVSYLVKMTLPVERLFMTYLETSAMNRQYQEAEALLIYDEKIKL